MCHKSILASRVLLGREQMNLTLWALGLGEFYSNLERLLLGVFIDKSKRLLGVSAMAHEAMSSARGRGSKRSVDNLI